MTDDDQPQRPRPRLVPISSGNSTKAPWTQWESVAIDPDRTKADLQAEFAPLIDRMQADIRAGLEPANAEALAVALKPFSEFALTMGLLADPSAWPPIAKQYADHLRDLPGDIVIEAFGELMRTWRWARMPLPGDVRLLAEPKREARYQRQQLIVALARRIGASGPRLPEAG